MDHLENEFHNNHGHIAGRSVNHNSLIHGEAFRQNLHNVCGFHVPKKIVLAAHRKHCGELNIRNYTREEARLIKLYFENFAIHSDVLIPVIRNEIVNNGQHIL